MTTAGNQESSGFSRGEDVNDESSSYPAIGAEMASHQSVNHAKREYVRGMVSTNKAEKLTQLKRSLDGTHHSNSKEHLCRYLAEFDFRYSTREMSDAERMGMLIDRSAGLRVSYKRIKRAGE